MYTKHYTLVYVLYDHASQKLVKISMGISDLQETNASLL